MQLSGQRLQQQTPAPWNWHGRAVKIVAGSGVSMPDTEATQQAYPPPGSQAPGLGVPVARLVVVLSLACGAVLAAAVGRITGQQTSAPMLFHRLHEHLERDDARKSGSDWDFLAPASVRGLLEAVSDGRVSSVREDDMPRLSKSQGTTHGIPDDGQAEHRWQRRC
jgi:hypothetical protein